MAEDSSGIIVRMYEAYGGRCTAQLQASSVLPVTSVEPVNLLEESMRNSEVR